MVTIDADDDAELMHYGIIRRSGRYPWGTSGWGEGEEEGVPRHVSFLSNEEALRKEGLTEAERARALGLESTTQLRAYKTIAKNEQKHAQILEAQRLKNKGMGGVAIGKQMGIPESTVRTLLAPGAADKVDNLTTISNVLKGEADKHTYVDIGRGVESWLGVSKEKLNVALEMAKEAGYLVHPVKLRQAGTGKDTNARVMVPPGITQRDVFLNQGLIRLPSFISNDGGRTMHDTTRFPPVSISPRRVQVRFAEDGGNEADGVIYVREGKADLSLGHNRYAQVRIQIGKDKFLKGMAIYKDDMPDGVDLVFNTKKPRTKNKMDAMKDLVVGSDLPFESVTRPVGDPDKPPTSAMNLVNEQGDWGNWSRSLSSQVLSKQKPSLAKNQLAMLHERQRREYDDISRLTNPTVRKKLLANFADEVDSQAVHLEAANLPKQNWHVLLPVESMKPTEIFAPGYENGDVVAVIRFPHGGKFEIPLLTVNNRNPEARKLLEGSEDAVGIHHTVADRLSGADFDGDAVLVIPNRTGLIQTEPALEQLRGFDTMMYRYPKADGGGGHEDTGVPKMKSKTKQQEMGNISNLITDMTIKGAPNEHIARAVKHSMVVIDAEKHHLNYKQSAIDNGIPDLKRKYQGKGVDARAGAATLISRARSQEHVFERKDRPAALGGPVDPETGEKRYIETMRLNQKGERRKTRSTKLAEKTDARDLISDPYPGTEIERIYADHSNKMKALANQARLDALRAPPLKRNPSAARTYTKQVQSLNAKLTQAKQNAPLERQAQVITEANVRALRQANPHLERETIKKLRFQELNRARERMRPDGGLKTRIEIDQDEWDAIQAGAVSNHVLKQILDKADIDIVRQLATPRREILMTSTKTIRAKNMLALGYTRAEVAKQLGVSLTTLDNATVTGG